MQISMLFYFHQHADNNLYLLFWSNCRIPGHFEGVPPEELNTQLRGERRPQPFSRIYFWVDTRIRSECRPQPFSRNDKYISGWIHGYAVNVDPSLSKEIEYISGWRRGYEVSVDPSLSQEMISIFLGGYLQGKCRSMREQWTSN